jgi:hypothetical protein
MAYFKGDLYQYITAAVPDSYGNRKFNRLLAHTPRGHLARKP